MGRGTGRGGMDWNSVFAYDTVKIIRIKNACVGLTHYFFMFLIFIYLVVYVFIMQKKYLEMDTPITNARFATMGPCQPLTTQGTCQYSDPDGGTPAVGEKCKRAFQCDRLPYCLPAGKTNSSHLAGGQMKCVYVDHNTGTWPPSESNALTIATRMSYYKQALKQGGPTGLPCAPAEGATGLASLPQTDWNCQYEPSLASGKSADGFVADVGNFTISIAQAMTATKLPISLTGMHMKGNLLRCKEGESCTYDNFEKVKEFIPDAHNRGEVVLTLEDILNAVVPADHIGKPIGTGVDLDGVSSACPDRCKAISTGVHGLYSNRWMGMVIVAEIQYDNTGLIIPESSPDDVRFNIRFWSLKSSLFRVEVPFNQKGHTRSVHAMHGIRIVTLIKGKLGLFSWNTMLLQLSTSFALVFVATTIMDTIITMFMQNRAYYNYVKYEDDEERLVQLEHYLEDADISDEVKATKISEIMRLKAMAGFDWGLATTCGMRSDAPVIDEDLFDTKITPLTSDIENKAEEPTEETSLVGGGGDLEEQRENKPAGCGCMVS